MPGAVSETSVLLGSNPANTLPRCKRKPGSGTSSPLTDSMTTGSPTHRPNPHHSRAFARSISQRARRVRFFRNGDPYYKGTWFAIGSDRFRALDSLMEELTRVLGDLVVLPAGVRVIFSIDGRRKVAGVEELADGESYVCASTDAFKPIDYLSAREPVWNYSNPKPCRLADSSLALEQPETEERAVEAAKEFIRPRIVTIIRHGVRPRRVVRLLLNRRTAPTFRQVLQDITAAVKLDSGAVRKIFTLTGKQVSGLADFFGEDDVFIACGKERISIDDFYLASEGGRSGLPRPSPILGRRFRTLRNEKKISRPPSQRQSSPIPEEEPPPEDPHHPPNNTGHPVEIEELYDIGKLVGDGNFATVHAATHRVTGERIAMKIIEKANCRGKEELVETEVRLLRRVEHPNIVRLLDVWDLPSRYYLAMELVPVYPRGKEELVETEVRLLRRVEHPNIVRLLDVWDLPSRYYLAMELVPVYPRGKEELVETEVRLLRRVEHPNIVRLLDVWDLPSRYYLAMELVPVYPRGKEELVETEVRLLRRVEHPNIVRLLDVWDLPSRYYLAMELVPVYPRGKEELVKTEVRLLRRVEHPNIVRLLDVWDLPSRYYLAMELVPVYPRGKEELVETEVRLLRRVEHPNIVRLLDVWDLPSRYYLAMELVPVYPRGKEELVETEVRLLRRVEHPNIVRLLDVWDLPSRYYLAMELVPVYPRGKEELVKTEVRLLRRVEHPNIVRLLDVWDLPSRYYLAMELVPVYPRGKEELVKTEVRLLRRVEHPNIVRLLDVWDLPSRYYLAMELVPVYPRGKEELVETEVRLLRRVEHPNIVRLLDVWDLPSRYYLAMELVPVYPRGKEELVETEVRLLRRVEHPNIVRLLDVWDLPSRYYLAMELVPVYPRGKEELVETEVRLLRRVEHPNIVRLLDVWDLPSRYYLAMELVPVYPRGKEELVETEVRLLRRVEHPNIVRLLDVWDLPSRYYLAMELVPDGDLFDALVRVKYFEEIEASCLMANLAAALDYLHSLDIVHRDVKPENLLLFSDEEGRSQLKLADFGLAADASHPLYTVCGTPTYVCPELLSENGYGVKVDVWAMGVILYIMLCGFPPFISTDNSQEELFAAILGGELSFPSPFWDPISAAATSLVQGMLQSDEQDRFSAAEVLVHPWITYGYEWNQGEALVDLPERTDALSNEDFDVFGSKPSRSFFDAESVEFYSSRRRSMDDLRSQSDLRPN